MCYQGGTTPASPLLDFEDGPMYWEWPSLNLEVTPEDHKIPYRVPPHLYLPTKFLAFSIIDPRGS